VQTREANTKHVREGRWERRKSWQLASDRDLAGFLANSPIASSVIGTWSLLKLGKNNDSDEPTRNAERKTQREQERKGDQNQLDEDDT